MSEIKAPEKDCWISLVHPTEVELANIAKLYEIDPDDLKAALDEEERSRIEVEDTYTLVLVDIPTVEKHKGKDIYTTMPLGILLAKDAIITVCLEETPVLHSLKQKHANELRTNMRTRFSIGAREWNNRWCECGPTHHFAAASGSYTDTIIKVAKILDVPVEVVCR